MIELISKNKKQYKANLHCHSILSDGKRTPAELKEMYKSHGYDILAITDHERPYNHQSLGDKDFILLTGYEAYIRPDPSGRSNVYSPELHLNLFAKDPTNVRMICFNEHYCKYLKRDNALDGLDKVGSEQPRQYTVPYINEYIRTATENGYLVSYNHPYWSMESEERIMSYEGYFSIEMCNYSSWTTNHLEHSGALYDRMLCRKMRVFCHGADDNHNEYPEGHPRCDSYGAFTMIIPEDFTYESIIAAMESGNMYSSMGPVFHSISVDGDKVHIECSEVEHAFLYMGSKSPAHAHATDGTPLTSIDFTVDPNAKYIRFSIEDSKGRKADTRGFFPEEFCEQK